jgi:outer membrane protein
MQTFAIRRSLLALAFAPAIAGAQGSSDTVRQISLDDAVRLARQNAPATTQARGALRVGRLTITNALAQFLPNLGLNASTRNSTAAQFIQGKLTPYTGTEPWNSSRSYGANVVLFDGGQRWFNFRAAQSSQTANAENELFQQFNVALSVKQQYYAVLAARESEAAADRQLEQATQQLRVTSARVRAGAAIRSDSLRSAIAVGTAQLAIINAQNNLRVANASLTRLVASPDEVTAVAADTSEVPRIELDSAKLGALAESGPGVRQATASLEASRSARKATLTSYLPSVTANYGFSTSHTSANFDWMGGPGPTGTGYGFSVNFTVFDNFRRELSMMTANVNEENATVSLRDARFAARENLAQYLGTYRTAAQTIELQLLQIAAAEEDFKAQQSRYAVGASALLDVLTSQSALDNARTALISARLQARTAKAQLEALVGRDLK